MRLLIALLAQLPSVRQGRGHPLGGDPDVWIASPRSEEPDVSRPLAFWHCPVAGCSFAALNRMEHSCPLPPAASDTLTRVLAGLHSLDTTPAPRAEPTAEDLGAAVAPWESSAADVVRVLPQPAGVGA